MKKHVFLDQTVHWLLKLFPILLFFINKLKEHPIGCGINLPYFTGLNALLKNYKNEKLYSDNLRLFRCLAPHTSCTLRNLESKTKELFLCYCKFALVDPSTFQGITLYDLI